MFFVWYSIGLGVCGLWVSMIDVFWFLFRVVVLSGGFLASGFHCMFVCVCVCVCVCACMRARGLAHLVYLQERKNILINVKECREGSRLNFKVGNTHSTQAILRVVVTGNIECLPTGWQEGYLWLGL